MLMTHCWSSCARLSTKQCSPIYQNSFRRAAGGQNLPQRGPLPGTDRKSPNKRVCASGAGRIRVLGQSGAWKAEWQEARGQRNPQLSSCMRRRQCKASAAGVRRMLRHLGLPVGVGKIALGESAALAPRPLGTLASAAKPTSRWVAAFLHTLGWRFDVTMTRA